MNKKGTVQYQVYCLNKFYIIYQCDTHSGYHRRQGAEKGSRPAKRNPV